MRDISQIQS